MSLIGHFRHGSPFEMDCSMVAPRWRGQKSNHMFFKQTCTPESPGKKVSARANFSYLIVTLGLMILSFHVTCKGQSSGFSLSACNSFGTYDLNYDQTPGSQTGDTAISVLVYVEVGESDEFPSLDVSVHPTSWLFDTSNTAIDVIPKDILSGWASFLIEASRDDGIPQWGSGPVLRLADTEGIGVIVLDFPGKKPSDWPSEISLACTRTQFEFSSKFPVKEISLYDLDGQFVAGKTETAFTKWSCPKHKVQGVLLVLVKMADDQVLFRKIYFRE